MSTAFFYFNLILIGALLLSPGWVKWVPTVAAVYLLGSWTITAGFHRLFCHQSYQTHPFWHYFFAIFGTLFMYGSPAQWRLTHWPHHRRADTDLDPHPVPWTWAALLTKSYRHVPLEPFRARRLFREVPGLHWVVDRHYVEIFVTIIILLVLISPELLLRGVLPAIGLVQLVGGVHNAISHTGGRPRDLWFLEYILPAGGEWLHAHHHEHPNHWDNRTRWYHLDTGALFIKLIRSKHENRGLRHQP